MTKTIIAAKVGKRLCIIDGPQPQRRVLVLDAAGHFGAHPEAPSLAAVRRAYACGRTLAVAQKEATPGVEVVS